MSPWLGWAGLRRWIGLVGTLSPRFGSGLQRGLGHGLQAVTVFQGLFSQSRCGPKPRGLGEAWGGQQPRPAQVSLWREQVLFWDLPQSGVVWGCDKWAPLSPSPLGLSWGLWAPVCWSLGP